MSEEAKYAVIKASGTQVKVSEGDTLRVNRTTGDLGAEVVFPDVLLLADGGQVAVGTPNVSGARVVGEIVRHARGKKIRVYKYKRKKGYQRTIGHRQDFTFVRIKAIESGAG